MAQKNKVKELVGRGLNSYHTKALQQIHRIEKKNKEQNHKISILSNELDNDYLTKTEEGSVISLEHSKEGMVYLDELQGNTLVNYCTDGSKELTLNGDIDVEGTFVTTTEGVDNGKVDVICEGNTLVNLVETPNKSTTSNYTSTYKMKYAKENTEYTIGFKLSNVIKGDYTGEFNISIENTPNSQMIQTDFKDGVYKVKITTRNINSSPSLNVSDIVNVCFWTVGTNMGESYTVSDVYALEGDYLNNDIICFEGMQSVGQNDENGHKIEILSQNKNLCTVNSYSGVYHNKIETNIPCKKNTIYTLTFKDESDLNQSGSRGITLITHKTKTDKKDHGNIYTYAMGEGGKEYTFRESGFTFNTSDCCYISLTSNNMSSVPNLIIKEIQIEEGSQTSYSPHTFNKKEILLNEPLRAIGDIKDRFIKQGNKWYIERNCKQVPLIELARRSSRAGNTENYVRLCYSGNDYNIKEMSKCLCDTIKVLNEPLAQTEGIELVSTDTYLNYVYINVYTGNVPLEQRFNEGVKRVEQLNPNLIYQLETPIYEEITDVELTTYLDTTHISNNSIIPCNMKIKNSGYNAIIKPSTLYTIALDTNNSGTIGMNLGGAKGTTTNNVLTLTTPATLSDDSLRLYGKGIKGSKVRILEGDKTNWIPSFFEGMKSSFEDKVQEDGSYKMEILSNNENLLDDSQFEGIKTVNINGYECYDYRDIHGQNIKLKHPFMAKKGQKYYLTSKVIRKYADGADTTQRQYIGFSLEPNKGGYGHPDALFFVSGNGNSQNAIQSDIVGAEAKNNVMLTDLSIVNYGDIDNRCIYLVKDSLMLKSVNSFGEYIPHKSNKIQFSSIEPLRGVDDVKDRYIFKDDKLMIERNCGTGSLDGTASIYHCWTNNRSDIVSGYIYYHEHKPAITNIKQHSNVVCTDLPNNRGGHISTVEGFRNTSYFAFSIHKSKLGIEDINAGEVNQNIVKRYFTEHPLNFVYQLEEPIYEEVPFELQKIILEGYENGTLFFDTNIPPTSTVTYAGETPIVKSVKLNKTEVLNNTNDINDNIVPYLMDMDYRVVCLQLQSENTNNGFSMARLFGGVYEMLKRDIQSKRYSIDEYRHRLNAYLDANKITEEEYNKLGDMLNE